MNEGKRYCFSCDGEVEPHIKKGICQYCKDQARSMMQGMTKLTNEQRRGVKEGSHD